MSLPPILAKHLSCLFEHISYSIEIPFQSPPVILPVSSHWKWISWLKLLNWQIYCFCYKRNWLVQNNTVLCHYAIPEVCAQQQVNLSYSYYFLSSVFRYPFSPFSSSFLTTSSLFSWSSSFSHQSFLLLYFPVYPHRQCYISNCVFYMFNGYK